MWRFITIICLLLISLLDAFRVPVNFLWVPAVIVQSYPLIFVAIVLLLLITGGFRGKFGLVNSIACALALVLYCSPLIRGYSVAKRLNRSLEQTLTPPDSPRIVGFSGDPIHWAQLFSFGTPSVSQRTMSYDTVSDSRRVLDLYPSQRPGLRPCVIVIHGDMWPGGGMRQLPELNCRLASEGYVVAAISYRHGGGIPDTTAVSDVLEAMNFLRRRAADLSIDTTAFVLLGRSEGAAVALRAAYTLEDPALKGVIDFYGATDSIRPLVTPYCVPTLILHGQQDTKVDYSQSRQLSHKLADSGVRHYFLTLPWATHSFDYALNGPGGQLSTYVVERFLQEVAP